MTIQDNLESYNVADLAGQGGWSCVSGNNSIKVTTTNPKTGSKHARYDHTLGDGKYSKALTDPTETGAVEFWVSITGTNPNDSNAIHLYDGNNNQHVANIQFLTNNKLAVYNGVTNIELCSYVANHYYNIKIYWRKSDGKQRVIVDDTYDSDWTTPHTAGWASVTTFRIHGWSTDEDLDIDDISDPNTPPAAAGKSQGIII